MLLYMVQWLVLMGLLMLKELVQTMSLVNALGLIRKQDGVAVEGNTQLGI